MVSNSGWVLTGNTPVTTGTQAVVFQGAPWASTSGGTGIWWRGFAGRPGDTANGTGGSAAFELTGVTTRNTFLTHALSLSGVTAGDQITVRVEMIDAAVPDAGPSQSVLMDNFVLKGPGGGGWEPVGGWAFADGSFNDPGFPSEFAGLNAMQFADFNNDGWQDLIVATMGGGGSGPNRDMLYVNRGLDAQGDWLGFHLVSWEIGFGGNDSGDMGVTVADIDNDGDLDYYTTDGGTAHSVWLNQFADTGELMFVETFIQGVFAWGANFHDFDNNGRVDLLIGTQADRPPLLYLQDTDGVLTQRAAASGLTTTNGHRAVLVADFDRDGFSDVFIQNIIKAGSSPLGVELHRNLSAALNPDMHFLNVTLEGDPTLPGTLKSTRDAIGARVYVTADFDGNGVIGADETRMEEVLSGHSQAAATSSLSLEFGLGKATTADLRIVWGSGREHTMTVGADQFLIFNEGNLSALPGDLNRDGFVGIEDLNVVLGNWNQSVIAGNNLAGDPSGDGFVGIEDLNAVLGNWNAGAAPVQAVAVSASAEPVRAETTSQSTTSEPRPQRRGQSADTGHAAGDPTRGALAAWAAHQRRAESGLSFTAYMPLPMQSQRPDATLGLWEADPVVHQ